jgi:hypothetical protein
LCDSYMGCGVCAAIVRSTVKRGDDLGGRQSHWARWGWRSRTYVLSH